MVPIKLMTYCWPSAIPREHKEFKGVVFYIHGFSEYCKRQAHFAKEFSQLGFDFYCMDSRGHGESEGQHMFIHSIDQCADDHFDFHRRVIDELYTTKPKVYLLAHSFGAMQATNAMLRNKHLNPDGSQFYSSVCFLCPFWSMPNFAGLKKVSWILSMQY